MKNYLFGSLLSLLMCCTSVSDSQPDGSEPIPNERFFVTRIPITKGQLVESSIFLIKDTETGQEFLAADRMYFIRIK